MADLTDRHTHYAFGENWARFVAGLNDAQIDRAAAGIVRLLGDEIVGKSFLDLGCGSGLHSLAALRLGAASVTAVDIDPRSVDTTRALLARYAAGQPWTAATCSAFDLMPDADGHDIVYSWGVLHHTGDMRRAIKCAAALVRPGGRLVLAIYRRTPMCRFWRVEKRLYSHAPAWLKAIADMALAGLIVLALAATGRNPSRYIRAYPSARGMSFLTDVRDWLGGYPYDSAAPSEIDGMFKELGFTSERFFPCNTRIGLLGVGCDEYVFSRPR